MEETTINSKQPYLRPVVTLIIYKDGKILLQKREDNGCWAIHGGGIELGEKYIEALNREIEEELNIKPTQEKNYLIFIQKAKIKYTF